MEVGRGAPAAGRGVQNGSRCHTASTLCPALVLTYWSPPYKPHEGAPLHPRFIGGGTQAREVGSAVFRIGPSAETEGKSVVAWGWGQGRWRCAVGVMAEGY